MPTRAKVIRCAVTGLAVLPWLTALFRHHSATRDLSLLFDRLYGLQCHQRVHRTFAVFGEHLPVCARCTGIYLGIGLAVWVGRPRLRLDALKAWMLSAGLVLLADVLSESVGLRPASAVVRALTGALLAYGIGLVIWQWARTPAR